MCVGVKCICVHVLRSECVQKRIWGREGEGKKVQTYYCKHRVLRVGRYSQEEIYVQLLFAMEEFT